MKRTVGYVRRGRVVPYGPSRRTRGCAREDVHEEARRAVKPAYGRTRNTIDGVFDGRDRREEVSEMLDAGEDVRREETGDNGMSSSVGAATYARVKG
jgi:acetyl-CoA carboxylase carboxyltransferase component